MSSSLPLALVVLLVASGVARAADQAAPLWQADVASHARVDLRPEVGANLGDPVGSDSALAERTMIARVGAPERSGGKGAMSSLKVHLGRLPAFGRSPGAAPPTYGEVAINVAPLPGLSLVPSYKVVLDDESAGGAKAVSGQVLKLGARIRF
jgi:hypothetical protein